MHWNHAPIVKAIFFNNPNFLTSTETIFHTDVFCHLVNMLVVFSIIHYYEIFIVITHSKWIFNAQVLLRFFEWYHIYRVNCYKE